MNHASLQACTLAWARTQGCSAMHADARKRLSGDASGRLSRLSVCHDWLAPGHRFRPAGPRGPRNAASRRGRAVGANRARGLRHAKPRNPRYFETLEGGRKLFSDIVLTKTVFGALREAQPPFHALFGIKTLSKTFLRTAFNETGLRE